MNTDSLNDNSNSYLSQLTAGLLGANQFNTLAVAGAALLGSALYYYMNSGSNISHGFNTKLVDYKNQTRPVSAIITVDYLIAFLSKWFASNSIVEEWRTRNGSQRQLRDYNGQIQSRVHHPLRRLQTRQNHIKYAKMQSTNNNNNSKRR